jgi:hypothetical protein
MITFPFTLFQMTESGDIFGDGRDGSPNISGQINNYYHVTDATRSAGTITINLNSTSGLSVGDCILIHQSQDYAHSGNNIGIWEMNYVKSVGATQLELRLPLTNTYYSNKFNQVDAQVTQVVRVPMYDSPTMTGDISAPTYNGYKQGIVAFKVKGTLTVNSGIEVENGRWDNTSGTNYLGRGFRGGTCNGCGNADWGDVGEGWKGFNGQSQVNNNGDNGGGGSYGPSGYGGAPACGGGNGGRGGHQNFSNGPAAATGVITCGGLAIERGNNFAQCFEHMIFGGGAGGGGDNDGHTPFPEYVAGGGVVMAFINIIGGTVPFRIRNEGQAGIQGNNGTGYDYDTGTGSGGKTGGGAGGSIAVVCNQWNTGYGAHYAFASGSVGAWEGGYPHYAGDGGGGRVALLLGGNSQSTRVSIGSVKNEWALYIDSKTNHNHSNSLGEAGVYYIGAVEEWKNYAGAR